MVESGQLVVDDSNSRMILGKTVKNPKQFSALNVGEPVLFKVRGRVAPSLVVTGSIGYNSYRDSKLLDYFVRQ